MVGRSLERVQVRAARIAGILLGHDFDSVYRDLIKDWAQGSAPYRQCAALAMETAAEYPQLAPRVRNQVRAWSHSPNFRYQDSAARVYGTPVGAQDVTEALWELRELGSRQEMAVSSSVAFSMALLFLSGAVDPVADSLGRWITSGNDHLCRHAARTMLILGRYAVGPELRARPVLANLAMGAEARRTTLERLWGWALTDQDSTERAWELLRRWLLAGDQDEKLAEFLAMFVPQVCTDRLASRAGFHLARWKRRHPTAVCLRRVLGSFSVSDPDLRLRPALS
jgi:hypothetical protein